MRYRVVFAVLVFVVICGGASARISGERRTGPDPVLVLDGSPVHDAGQLWLHTSNWGGVGSLPGSGLPFSDAPSAEWPGGSGIEYLYAGGLWVGAVVDGVPHVSQAAYDFEFRPTDDPRDIVYRSSEGAPGGNRLPAAQADDDGDGAIDEDPLDGRDNDGDGRIDEDFAAISDQMFSCWYTDDQPGIEEIYPNHHPLHVTVRQRSYQWSHPDFDDFVGFDYEITNTGDQVLEDVCIGIFLDGDCGPRNVDEFWQDDVAEVVLDQTRDTGYGPVTFDYAYTRDYDGDGGQTPGRFGVVFLDHPTDATGSSAPERVGIRTYWGFESCGAFDCDNLPTSDYERYQEMFNAFIDDDYPGRVPHDPQLLAATGPFGDLEPGQTIRFSTALVATPVDGDFENVANAVVAYRGQWFDVDGDPNTGEDGKEYRAHWWLPGQEPPVETASVNVKITPQTIHLDAMGDPLLAHVTLPAGYRASDVDAATVRLGGHSGTVQSGGGGRTLVARFSRKALGLAAGTHQVTFSCTAKGQPMSGTDVVRVIARGPQLAEGAAPSTMSLSNSPNPFNPTTRIAFELTDAADVILEVYSADGTRVRRLASGRYPAGAHGVVWNGTDDGGRAVASGIYFYRLRAGTDVITKKMVLIK